MHMLIVLESLFFFCLARQIKRRSRSIVQVHTTPKLYLHRDLYTEEVPPKVTMPKLDSFVDEYFKKSHFGSKEAAEKYFNR